MERIARMSRMHSFREYFSSVVRIDGTKKQNKQKEEIFFWSREKKREKCQLEERSKFFETRSTTTGDRY